ncbi:MAG: hypothetical protein OXE49_10030, partial [Gemmatimonadetes bacterium]|nr:hypothetical protein [Gemmatimonadota bacterium]
VANMGAGQIVALPDSDRDGIDDERIVSLRGLEEAHSLLAATQKRPVALVPAHYAPMGLHYRLRTGEQVQVRKLLLLH